MKTWFIFIFLNRKGNQNSPSFVTFSLFHRMIWSSEWGICFNKSLRCPTCFFEKHFYWFLRECAQTNTTQQKTSGLSRISTWMFFPSMPSPFLGLPWILQNLLNFMGPSFLAARCQRACGARYTKSSAECVLMRRILLSMQRMKTGGWWQLPSVLYQPGLCYLTAVRSKTAANLFPLNLLLFVHNFLKIKSLSPPLPISQLKWSCIIFFWCIEPPCLPPSPPYGRPPQGTGRRPRNIFGTLLKL